MPRYFIDTDDGDDQFIDDEGFDLANEAAARVAALAALPDMARDKIPGSDSCVFRVSARDESGEIIYFAEMKLRGSASRSQ